MKTKEELKAIKEEVETLNKKLCELSEEELAQVTGGVKKNPAVLNTRIGIITGGCSLFMGLDGSLRPGATVEVKTDSDPTVLAEDK